MRARASQTSGQIHATAQAGIIEESKGIVDTISADLTCDVTCETIDCTFKAPCIREVSTSGAH